MTVRSRRPSELRSLSVGDVRVSYVPDGFVQLKPRGWFPRTTAADWIAEEDYLDEDTCLVASVGSVLVERDGAAMLIDAGYGVFEQGDTGVAIVGRARGGQLLDNLARLGRAPADIDIVAVTHLHADHIGWAQARVDGQPAFSRARVVLSDEEWADRASRFPGVAQPALDRLAERVETVQAGREIWPGVHALATPGHTPGHLSYVITAGAERVVVIGDALHSSVQVGHPHWHVASDADPVVAAATRADLVRQLAQPHTLGVGGHFADQVFGRVAVDVAGRARWEQR